MRLVICQTPEEVSRWAAHYLQRRIREFAPTLDQPFVLGLPTGGTPQKMYQRLIELHRQGQLSFQRVRAFNLDEYVGLPGHHPASYHAYLYTNLFNQIDILPDHIHLLQGDAPDLQAECDRYEAALRAVGGLDLLIGGVGHEGHIAFNELGSSLASRTRVTPLTYHTRLANARFFNHALDQVPRCALTMGVGTILEAREVLILAQGAHKAQAVQQAIEGGVNPLWAVTALQFHPNAILVCDEDATLELKVKTVKYFKEMHDHLSDIQG